MGVTQLHAVQSHTVQPHIVRYLLRADIHSENGKGRSRGDRRRHHRTGSSAPYAPTEGRRAAQP
ncbi:protein of unknown function [Streptomyces sp. KY75]|nr:protein of unknown function [Streptomyces sp. KY75]CAD5980160.1 protein of unknown function [Streptomyces sp. KY70]